LKKENFLFITICLLIFIKISGCGTGSINLYVSPEGSDAWSGNRKDPNRDGSDGPYATVERARDTIRTLKEKGKFVKPVIVYIREGLYELNEPLVFTPEDSGSDEYPIIYSAYPGESPVFSGGRRVTGWKRDRNGMWIVELPDVKNGDWYFRQLFVNGRRCIRARVPNDSFFHVDGMISMDDQAKFAFRDSAIKKEWVDLGNVEVFALQKWAEFRMFIKDVDETHNTVILSRQCRPSNREENARFRIENVFEELDVPGEWYLNSTTGILSYIPRKREDMTKAEVFAPFLNDLVRFKGEPQNKRFVKHITIRGLTFVYTDWSIPENGYADVQAAYDIPAVITAEGAVSVTIDKCIIKHHGNYGIEFAYGCTNNDITGNEITDMGAGGVKIGEPRNRENESEKTYSNNASDNHIFDIGLVYPAACGIIIFRSGKNKIAHNHIHDTYYTGISNGWSWGYAETDTKENIIEYNHVHNIGRGMLSDMGGNYNLGVQPGTVIRNNLFHDITSYGYGGWGIYTDEGSSYILIENNIVFRTKTGGFHQHYGRENIVRNNIFAFAQLGQIIRTREEKHLSFIFERNIVYWNNGPLLGSNWTNNQYFLDYNLYYNANEDTVKFKEWTFEEWQKRGQDVHSIIADPLFENPIEGDFTLKKKSPAIELGFTPINMNTVGPRE